MESELQEQYDDAKRLVLELHRRFLNGDPAGIPLNLQGEDLRYSLLDGTDLSRASFNGAKFRRAEFIACNFHLSTFVGARFTRVRMDGALVRPTRPDLWRAPSACKIRASLP
jgi:uncharacterized protein YjbI with pentapeptide repeats